MTDVIPKTQVIPSQPGLYLVPFSFLFLILVIFLVSLVVGKFCARKAEKLSGKKPRKWLLLVVSFFLAIILFMASADLGRLILKYHLSTNWWTTYSHDQLIKQISARMVVILLDFPLLAWSWYQATAKVEDSSGEKAEVLTRKYFLNFEILFFGVILFLLLGICLYNFFNWVLGVTEVEWTNFSAPLSYGILALIFFTVKLLKLASAKNKLKSWL